MFLSHHTNWVEMRGSVTMMDVNGELCTDHFAGSNCVFNRQYLCSVQISADYVRVEVRGSVTTTRANKDIGTGRLAVLNCVYKCNLSALCRSARTTCAWRCGALLRRRTPTRTCWS